MNKVITISREFGSGTKEAQGGSKKCCKKRLTSHEGS